mmetsp:Transcript_3239/g.4371  ORF Transcript_3239/g.4371 Transcript_3239/m.4371 type:complete len:86 (-) Transcript_3239:1391-1648(-)
MRADSVNGQGAEAYPSQVTGMLGSRIETRQQMQKKLSEILNGLNEQMATLKSVEAKIVLMESFLRQARGIEQQNKLRADQVKMKL